MRDASEAAGVWQLDADASGYLRLQDLTVAELEAALDDRTGPFLLLFKSSLASQ